MLKIEINAIPVDDVIRNLAKSMNTQVKENCSELELILPENIGKGKIFGIQFNNGFGFIQYDCTFKESTEIRLLKSEIHPLKFLYVFQGNLAHRFSNSTHLHEIKQYQHAIVASEKHNGHILKFREDERACFSSIELDRKEFENKIACNLKGVSSDLTAVFYDVKATKSFYHNGYYSLKISDIIDELNEYRRKNFIRKIFLEGFTLQMLAEEILQYEDAKRDKEESYILTRYELGAVKTAAQFIEKNIFKNLLVRDVAVQAGINQNKLQNGFKNQFGSTVHEFIKQQRLQFVKDLLVNTDLQIGEISDRVGINSKSYFSKLFKERYGMTPKEFKRKQTIT